MRDTSKTDGGPLPRQVHLHTSDELPPTATLDFRFPRFPGVTPKIKAADHCPVFLDIA